jgi:mono/diheme cytochrome c family protein
VKLALVVLVAAAAACSQGVAASADGAEVYASACAVCHGKTGKPDEGMVARIGVRDLTSRELRARVTPALVEAQVRNGSKNKLMPSFVGALTDPQIAAVSAYVAAPAFVKP